MSLYLWTALLIVILSLFFRGKRQKIGLLIGCIYLFVITAFRDYAVGIDTVTYEMMYNTTPEDIHSLSLRALNERFFAYLMFFLSKLGYTFRAFLIVISILFYALVYYVLSKQPRSVEGLQLFYLLCFPFMFFNITRQMIAVMVSLIGFLYLEKGHKKIWVAMFLLSIGIHTSAFVTILFYPFTKIKLYKSQAWLASLLLIVTFFVPFAVSTDIIADFFNQIALINNQYGNYLTEDVGKGIFSWSRVLMNVMYIMILFIDKENVKSPCLIMMLFYLMVLNIFPFSGIIVRINLYFSVFQVLFFVRKINGDGITMRIISYVYCFAVFMNMLLANNGGVVPYIWAGL